METIQLHSGEQAEVYFKHDMYRADISGRHYCSQDKNVLLRCISECHTAVIPETVPEPIIPVAEQMFRQLKTGPLEMKQSARRRLLQLAELGDEDAIKYLGSLPNKPISLQATYLAKSLGKDFIDMTFYDFSEHVNDLVLRNKLFKELTSLFEMEA